MKTKILVAYSTNRDEYHQKIFNKEIKKSIGCDFDVFPVYNAGSKSLSRLYNQIWQQYPYDESYIFVFCHHDIHFKCNGWGKALLNLFNGNPETHVIGIAGTDAIYEHGTWWLDKNKKHNKLNLWGKVWHTDGKKHWKSDFTTVNRKCNKLQPVVSIDGSFIAFDPDVCEEFDEDMDGFHFYDLGFCARNKNIFVTESIQIQHDSIGPLSEAWELNRRKFVEKYPNGLYINKDKLL